MAAWHERVDQLRFDGEEVLLRVGEGDDAVVVTTHRVMAFTPESDGKNFRAVDRPNVTGVSRTTTGNARFVPAGVRALVVGAFLLGASLVIDFEGLLSTPSFGETGASQVGMGQILALFSLLRTVFAVLDEVLLLGGGLATALGLAAVGYYLATRQPEVIIEVAGEPDLRVPGGSVSDSEFSKLQGAIMHG
ncbi:MAG: hypothetical protein ABEJ27_00650 [Halodesulfurarchaeum sp.]